VTSSQSNLCDAQDDFPPAATAQNLRKLAKLIVPTGPQIIQMAGEGAKAPPHRKSNFSQASFVALSANLSVPFFEIGTRQAWRVGLPMSLSRLRRRAGDLPSLARADLALPPSPTWSNVWREGLCPQSHRFHRPRCGVHMPVLRAGAGMEPKEERPGKWGLYVGTPKPRVPARQFRQRQGT